jgi:ribosomal-protein-alanine acetyltransferase
MSTTFAALTPRSSPRRNVNVLIRRATAADIPPMRSLEQQADTAAHWSEREYAALFAPEAPRRLALAAQDDNEQLCGFIVARCGIDEWEIENVIVAVQHRRRGIGRALVREILSSARAAGVGSVLLEVRDSNHAARQLYEALGFAEVGRRQAYYRNPDEDSCVLRFSTHDL